jgi:long-chain acyl-CoA synthetase
MNLQQLQDKIDHARRLGHSDLPEISISDFPALINQYKQVETPCLIYIDEHDNRIELSYLDFCEEVFGVARFLQAHGLRRGDSIATISHNHWQTVIQYFAAWLLGLVVVPVNLDESDERIAYILDNGDVELAFVRAAYRKRIDAILERDDLKNIEVVICEETTGNFSKRTGELKLPQESLEESSALIIFTSGTTGDPKGVVLTQRNLLEDARSIGQWHHVDGSTRMMCVLPIHHVNGTVVTLITPFFFGGSAVLNQRFRVSRFFPIIQQEGVHIVSVVPTLLQFLTNYYVDGNGAERPETPTLQHIICSAGPLTVQLMEEFEKKMGVQVIHGYGLSETTCESCFVPLDLNKAEHEKWRSSFGYPSIGVDISANQMEIHDQQGNALAENERGEIVIRGVNVMKEYYHNKQANEQAFKYGWFRSGDEGFFVRDDIGRKFFFITGRLKEIIIRGAVNLAPLEIDEVINKAPGVKSGIAVGFKNDWYGEEVGAYVQLKEGAPEDDQAILRYCRDHLPFSKSPKAVVFGDSMPVTSTGKYQRRKVEHLFEKWEHVQFKKG